MPSSHGGQGALEKVQRPAFSRGCPCRSHGPGKTWKRPLNWFLSHLPSEEAQSTQIHPSSKTASGCPAREHLFAFQTKPKLARAPPGHHRSPTIQYRTRHRASSLHGRALPENSLRGTSALGDSRQAPLYVRSRARQHHCSFSVVMTYFSFHLTFLEQNHTVSLEGLKGMTRD
nr:uncharacterized protein LOC123569387 [Macaca fascicularis]